LPAEFGRSPRAVVLGSAAGGGFPQWNCRCAVCTLAWQGDSRVTPRTQSSLAVTADGDAWVIVNASPDLREQLRALPDLWPRMEPRHSPIAAVVLTSAEVDHVAGLLHLRERQPFRLIALRPVHAALDQNAIFGVLGRDVVARVVARERETVTVAPSLSVELLAVPGKAPLFLETVDPAIGVESGETAGVMIRVGASTLAYVPGCAELTPALLEELSEADVLLFDGTLFTDDEMIAAGVGPKTGRRMGHIPISGPHGSLEALGTLKARKIYVHLNNTNPILIEGSAERDMVESQGVEIAHDGMEIVL
jgi:pyrroloquinoline quinone biosynthesis protein B